MHTSQNINIQEGTDIEKIFGLITKNYKLFIIAIIISLAIAFIINRYKVPVFKITSSILIKENRSQQNTGNVNDFLNSNLLGRNQNFQNELWVMKSYPVIEETVRNLGLTVTYFTKGKFNYYEVYQVLPFKVTFMQDHAQPINTKIGVTLIDDNNFKISVESKKVYFYNYKDNEIVYRKDKWSFSKTAKFGELIETPDMAIVLEPVDSTRTELYTNIPCAFEFKTLFAVANEVKSELSFSLVDRLATVIRITMRSESPVKGKDIVNELMSVYSGQNLAQKNHLASITINYIEKQLGEIADSLSQTEDNLQNFRVSNQLLDITNQATGLSAQYLDLQNQLAELVSRKRYYDYVADFLSQDNFSNMMLPASIGIPDPLLNQMMSELISAQAQRSNLIENNQEKNPLVQKLGIQIETLKKTISENVSAFGKSSSISIDEMNKRISKIENQISRLPATQRQLGTIERKFRLNDAIYNYLMEKHAEAKITQASNLPDNLVIEPAKQEGIGPVSPNKRMNYAIALLLGFVFPFGYLILKNSLNNKIESQEDIEKLTDNPLLGKVLHSRYKTNNIVHEFPKSNLAESFRSLRTNLDFYVRGDQKRIILVTSCLENEGKSFISLNLSMSYAQLGRKTILLDFDLRKPKTYFAESDENREGLSSYMINKAEIKKIINKSPNHNLDYIMAGILPPNPVELLAMNKTANLLASLKDEYDIIILDTPPLAQVTDAYLLINNADVKIIVSRQNSTYKNVFSMVMKDLYNKKVNNICVVLNDNRIYTDQYGYGYGYYSKDKKNKFKNRKEKKVESIITK